MAELQEPQHRVTTKSSHSLCNLNPQTNPSFVGHYSQIHHQDSGPSPNHFAPDSYTPNASARRCPSSNGSGTQCNPSPRGYPLDPATLSHSKLLPYSAHSCGCTGLAATQAQGILVVTPSQLQSKHPRDDLLWIAGTPHLKAQALGLRGDEAACFNQLIHHVCCRSIHNMS